MLQIAILVLCLTAGLPPETLPAAERARPRRVAPGEEWLMRDGRFYRNGQWVFLKTGKLLRPFERPETADQVIAEIDAMIDRLHYNSFSLNIYPDTFDADADGRVDADVRKPFEGIGRILDHCWARGVFAALSFETYNAGGGGTPQSLFHQFPEVVAIDALGQAARDVEYGPVAGKLIPSIYHPAYLKWSRRFMQEFLRGLGQERVSRLLFIETTVEPQYLGQCNVGDKDRLRAVLDFSPAAAQAFERWQAAFPEEDRRQVGFKWPTAQADREKLIGNPVFNRFRAWGLAEWVNGDIEAIKSVAPDVYIAVDYNGRFDDPDLVRIGDHMTFLRTLRGVDVIQIAPHTWHWGTSSWDDVNLANREEHKGWAISEHMTVTGVSPDDDKEMTAILQNTLERGTRWGWEFVNAGNGRVTDGFQLYDGDWSSPITDVVEGLRWNEWLDRIGVKAFVPKPRELTTSRPG